MKNQSIAITKIFKSNKEIISKLKMINYFKKFIKNNHQTNLKNS